MNWKEIYEQSPHAFKACINWFNDEPLAPGEELDYLAPSDFLGVIYYRELYDFFDSQGIVVNCTKWLYWSYSINNEMYGRIYDDRKEAEEAAFTKAFELCEKLLAGE